MITFEQVEVPKAMLEWEMQFLVEGHEVEIASYEGELLGITLPAKSCPNKNY